MNYCSVYVITTCVPTAAILLLVTVIAAATGVLPPCTVGTGASDAAGSGGATIALRGGSVLIATVNAPTGVPSVTARVTWIITRLTIPLHLSFPSLHFMLDTPDPLMEQGSSSSI